VNDHDERVVGGLRVRIDRTLCVGFGDCVTVAVFVTPDAVTREQLLRACASCPVDALTAWNENGEQVVP